MFIALLFATFAVAFAVAFIVDALFKSSLDRILKRIISDDIYVAWTRYVRFALYVVGVSSGVKMWDLERYVEPRQPNETAPTLELTTERWVLEIYRAIIETLQGVAWMLLIFFVFALIAYVIARIAESRREKKE
ncbi:MAG: hypothetical protein NZM06_07415 [Chloroherpetonaceae bacterium]|nr:hypothetical protein [Chloroherpetonaceae bacterium]